MAHENKNRSAQLGAKRVLTKHMEETTQLCGLSDTGAAPSATAIHKAARPERKGGRWILEFLELTLFIAIGVGSSLPTIWPWMGVDSQAPCRMRLPQTPWSLSLSQIKSFLLFNLHSFNSLSSTAFL